jgi:hypothetical protein
MKGVMMSKTIENQVKEMVKILKDLYPNETLRVFSDTTLDQMVAQSNSQLLDKAEETLVGLKIAASPYKGGKDYSDGYYKCLDDCIDLINNLKNDYQDCKHDKGILTNGKCSYCGDKIT